MKFWMTHYLEAKPKFWKLKHFLNVHNKYLQRLLKFLGKFNKSLDHEEIINGDSLIENQEATIKPIASSFEVCKKKLRLQLDYAYNHGLFISR